MSDWKVTAYNVLTRRRRTYARGTEEFCRSLMGISGLSEPFPYSDLRLVPPKVKPDANSESDQAR